jgi:signal transduction histidine kinase
MAPAGRRPSSLIAHVVVLVAFALFAIEIAVLVPFTYLYWQRLLSMRRDELSLQANAARPHVVEALLNNGLKDDTFESEGPLETGAECLIYTPQGAYRLTSMHVLTRVSNAPPRSIAQAAFEPNARDGFLEVDETLVFLSPVHLLRENERPEAVLYVSCSLAETKRQFAGYGIFSFLVGAATLLVVGTISIWQLRRRLLIPLARMIAADNAARRGDTGRAFIGDEHIPPDELGTIMRSRNALLTRMTAVQKAVDEQNVELEQQRAELAAWGRQLERLVQEKTQELVAARENLYLTEKLAALGRLAANVAHEINNPLASIAGYAEEVRERLNEIAGAPPDLPDGLRVIEEQAFRCKEILKRLLGLARSDRFKIEPLDLSALARDTVKLCESSARKKGIALEVLAKEPVIAKSDASSLQQVILNLVENAVDAAAAGREQRGSGGHVSVSVAARSAARVDEREHVIRVADDGFGVPESIRARVFDPFYTTKPVGRGTGLGLAICQSIVERLGGRIEIESVEGHGATFVVVLPEEAPSQEGQDPEIEKPLWEPASAS